MSNPNVYPELILDSAQEKIRVLARKQARDEARRNARTARRRTRSRHPLAPLARWAHGLRSRLVHHEHHGGADPRRP
jgi:hypothetical protein